MKLYTCHIVDHDRYLRDGQTIRVCLANYKENADIWILPVDYSTSADIKVEIVKSYESPQYTAYICSSVEFQFKRDELNKTKTPTYSDDSNDIWSGVHTLVGRVKKAVAEQEQEKEDLKRRANESYREKQRRWNSLTEQQRENKRKERDQNSKKAYEKDLKDRPKVIFFYLLKIAISIGLVWFGTGFLFKALEEEVTSIDSCIGAGIAWILTVVVYIGALAVFIWGTYVIVDFFMFLKEQQKDYGGYFKGTTRKEISDIQMTKKCKVIKKKQFEECENLTSIIIPEGVKLIGEKAFYGCTNLMSITLPSTLKRIDKDAFMGCEKLLEIYNFSKLKLNLNDKKSYGNIMEHAVVIHHKKETSILKKYEDFIFMYFNKGYHLVHYNGQESEVVLPNEVDGQTYSIYENAFIKNKIITEITISSGVNKIPSYVFSNSALERVTVCEGVKEIESLAFSHCSSLEFVSFPQSLEKIGWNVFEYSFRIKYNHYKECDYIGNEKNPYLWLARTDKITYVHPRTKIIAVTNPVHIEVQTIYIPKSVQYIARESFFYRVDEVYYDGTKEELKNIKIDWGYNDGLKKAKVYLKDDTVTYFK